MKETNNTQVTFSFGGFSTLLTLIFVVLKLCGVVAWHWALVLLPTIISVGLVVFLLIVIGICTLILKIIEKKEEKDERNDLPRKKN